MKVAELIERLRELDENAVVLIDSANGSMWFDSLDSLQQIRVDVYPDGESVCPENMGEEDDRIKTVLGVVLERSPT